MSVPVTLDVINLIGSNQNGLEQSIRELMRQPTTHAMIIPLTILPPMQCFKFPSTRLHLQGKVARRAIVFNNLAQIMQSCTNPAISQIRIRHMRHALNTHEHQFDKTPPNRAR